MENEKLLQEISLKINTGELGPEEVLDKENLLKATSNKIRLGDLTREEVASWLGLEVKMQKGNIRTYKTPSNISYSSAGETLVILLVIIIVGLMIAFIAHIWQSTGPFGVILVLLGLALLAVSIGMVLIKKIRSTL